MDCCNFMKDETYLGSGFKCFFEFSPRSMKPMIQFDEHIFQMSNEKTLVVSGYMGDEILPSYLGIMINHSKDP